MRDIRALIGLPVIVNGKRVGRVIQAEISDDLTEMTGIWISSGFFGTRFISADCLGMLGNVSIIADRPGERKRCRMQALFRRAVGSDGSRWGAVVGARIDELSFHIDALELSYGLWDDLMIGRRYIRRFSLNQDTGNVVIDVSEIEEEVSVR